MLRALLRAVIVIVVLVAAGAFLLGWWGRGSVRSEDTPVVGTTGTPSPDRPTVDTSKAREAGAKVGETAAVAANQAEQALAQGSLTAKIKAKMALDDTVKALDINVDTTGSTVTLRGVVGSEPQRQRALQLARETNGVTQVVDRLTVR
jgi:osmotically-inducible protein OsmY